MEIKEEILDRFSELSEEHQLEVILWHIRQGIIKPRVEGKVVDLPGEISEQTFEQALKELKESGEIS